VKTIWIDASEVDRYYIRRPPPAVSRVRIVQLGDFDATACGGLHVFSTGQIGLCKITGSEKIRGRTRIHAKVGDRAYRDYYHKTQLLKNIGLYLTCGEDAILKRIEDLSIDHTRLKREVVRYQAEWISLLVDDVFSNAPVIQGVTYAQYIFENVDNKILKLFIERALTVSQRIVLLINRKENQLNWMMGQSLEDPVELKVLLSDLLPIIDAKGGGSSELVQGGGKNTRGIDDFTNKVRIKLERKLKGHE
jgi:alanyl-tRNA synthetase